MDRETRLFLEEQHRARLQVEEELESKREAKANDKAREAAFDQVVDIIMPSHGKIVFVFSVLGLVASTVAWLIYGRNPQDGIPIGVPLIGGPFGGMIVGYGGVRALTRIAIWRIMSRQRSIRLWHFPTAAVIAFPIVGLLFGMPFTFENVGDAVAAGIVVGGAISGLIFYKVTDHAVLVMAESSLSAAEAVNALREGGNRG